MLMPKPSLKKEGKKNYIYLLYILTTVLVFLVIELSIFKGDVIAMFSSVLARWILSLFSIALLVVIQLLIAALLNNYLMSLLFFSVSGMIIAVANVLRINFRGAPILPEDILLMNSIVEIIMMVNIWVLIFFVILIGIIISVAIYLFKRHRNRFKIFPSTKQFVIRRSIVIVLSLMIILSFRGFQYSGSWLLKASEDYAGFVRIRNNELANYQKNGFVYGFMSNFTGPPMRKPNGYSKEKIQEIREKYSQRSQTTNEKRSHDDLSHLNVILILSESLADPNRIDGVKLNINPLNYIQNPNDKALQGTLISPTYGGGTANAEFELLTSMSIQLLEPNMSLPYVKFIGDFDHFPTILDAHDYSLSLHAYNDKMFNRRDVYKTFGFDEVLFEKDFTYLDKIDQNEYISDASFYQEVMHQLKKHDQPVLLHGITMQNHAGYNPKYENNPDFLMSDASDATGSMINVYTNGLMMSDIETEKLIAQLDEFEEDTILVFYGDHLPGIYHEFEEQNTLKNLSETDFFIYSNFSDKKVYRSGSRSLGELTSIVKQVADTKVTAFDALVSRMRALVPASKEGEYYMPNELRYYEDLNQNQREVLSDFAMIQYDMVEGQQYGADMFKLSE